jgi:AraC-like DNA-binding protein
MVGSRAVAQSVIFCGSWSTEFAVGWKALEHQHPNVWEIMLVNHGSVEVHAAGRQQRGDSGSVFIHAPRTTHWETTASKEPLKMTGFYVRPPGRQVRLPDLLQDRHGRIGHALEWLRGIHDTESGSLPVLDHLAHAILHECQRKDDTLQDQRLVRARNFIHQRLGDQLSIARLAEIAGMSRRHFTREFSLFLQMSPMSYVRKVRLESARHAISVTNLTLREIAAQTGFRDEYEFSRVFRRMMGFAPSAIRKKQL